MNCPKYYSKQRVKSGKVKGRQRYKCKEWGNLIFKVVIVFAMFNTLSTLTFIPFNFKIRSNSL
jgi:hypothetical protein